MNRRVNREKEVETSGALEEWECGIDLHNQEGKEPSKERLNRLKKEVEFLYRGAIRFDSSRFLKEEDKVDGARVSVFSKIKDVLVKVLKVKE